MNGYRTVSKWNPYALKKPCENCPFLKDKSKAIQLNEGRVNGIISELLTGESTSFSCHKTVHHPKTGGKWVENEDGEESYQQSGKEQQCAGALAVLEKLNQPTQLMRIMERMGQYSRDQYVPLFDLVIDYDPQD